MFAKEWRMVGENRLNLLEGRVQTCQTDTYPWWANVEGSFLFYWDIFLGKLDTGSFFP